MCIRDRVTGVLTGRIVKRSQRYFVAQQKNLGDINGKVEETYAGHNVVCAFNREGATQKEFDAINARLYRSAWKSQFLSGLMSPVTTFVSKLGYVCVVVLGGSLAARGTITIGDIQAFLNYMANFTQPITQLAQISTQLQTMAAAAERVFAFLDEAEEPTDPALPAPAEHIRGDVSFRHVRFGYDPAQPVIHDWSCDVPAGRTVAIVGPTGAGKTTTLYAALREINTIDSKVLTAEDPVEYDIDGIIQIPINEAIGLDFPMVLRAFLRQDPDRILVGEMRDMATAQIAIQASLTGHLVLSTLHTNDSAGAITRLVDMGCEPFLVAASLEGVLAQRLVRTICPDCRTPYEPSSTILSQLGVSPYELGDKHFFTGRGCDKCSNSGYKGRKGIYELLDINDTLRDMITDRAPSVVLKQKAIEMGMSTLREDGLRNIYDGNTTIEEVLKYT